MGLRSRLQWSRVYSTIPVEKMNWYYPELDPDLDNALDDYNITSGTFLDLGTGPGTQAIELAKRGFSVTATDISGKAIKLASKLSDEIHFINDDILNSKLKLRFDYILDRGCFHTMSENDRVSYVKSVEQLLKKNGILFLKCFSDKEQGEWGPYRYSKEMIIEIFNISFNVLKISDTVYQGTMNPMPHALFVIMQRK